MAADVVVKPPVVPESAPSPSSDSDSEGLRAAVARASVSLTGDLYEVSQRLLEGEQARLIRIEGKATSLLTAAGLSVSVATGFGATTLLAHPEYFASLRCLGLIGCAVALFGAVLAGLVAALFALKVLKVREGRLVNPADAFRRDVLEQADVEYVAPDGDPVQRAAQVLLEPQKAAYWRQFMSDAHQNVFRGLGRECDEKAAVLRCGQVSYFVFLACLAVLVFLIALAAGLHGPAAHIAAPPPSHIAAPPPSHSR